MDVLDCKLGGTASQNCARGIFSMPCLRTLVLARVEFEDSFYETMGEEARNSKVIFLFSCLQSESVLDVTGLDLLD